MVASARAEGVESRGGAVAATAARALSRGGRSLAGVILCVVALSGLLGLLATAAAFAVARPEFTKMRENLLWARSAEDPVSTDTWPLLLVALGAAPVLLAVLALGCAATGLAGAAAVAGAADSAGRFTARRLGRRIRAGLGTVFAVHLVRGLAVAAAAALSFAACVGLAAASAALSWADPFRFDGPFDSLSHLVAMIAPGALLIRLGFALAPSCAALDGTGVWVALRRSWSLVWSRRAWPLTAGALLLTTCYWLPVHLLIRHLAGPLDSVVHSAVLAHVTPNTYVAHAAGLLTPGALAVLLSALSPCPLPRRVCPPCTCTCGGSGRAWPRSERVVDLDPGRKRGLAFPRRE